MLPVLKELEMFTAASPCTSGKYYYGKVLLSGSFMEVK